MLEFGRELFQLSQRLEQDSGINETNQKMLEVRKRKYLLLMPNRVIESLSSVLSFQDAFSLLAYSNPWSSPLGWQLCASRRETICAALNSAILGKMKFEKVVLTPGADGKFISESMSYSWRPPIEICLAHACQLLQLMSSSSLGSCAFATIEDILQPQ